jgi:lipoprotein NlpD
MPCHLYFKSVCFIIFLSLIGCQSFQFDPWPDDRAGVYHTVQKGQTLYQIATIYDLNVGLLRRTNHIGDPKKIRIGTQLWIPGARRILSVPTTDKPGRATKKHASPKVKPRKGFLVWPTKGTLTSRFGMRNGRKHEGIDIAAPKGTPIHAAAGGRSRV